MSTEGFNPLCNFSVDNQKKFKKSLDFKSNDITMSLFLTNNYIVMLLDLYNPHWDKDFFYDIGFKRNLYKKIKKQINNRFIINISWLRRVWKTTLLKQLTDFLIKRNDVKREHIFFYSFDGAWEIEEKIKEYQKIFNINFFHQKVYIFFDEIQKVKDWQSKIKIYYDMYPNIKFVLTWSNSLYLQKRESLAWRMYEYTMKPLYFDEYLRFKKLSYFLENTNIHKDKIIREFESYIFRQFIDIIDFSNREAILYVNTLINKIIKEDISAYFNIEYPDVLMQIFKIIRTKPWMLMDYKNFANNLNIDQRTLEKYIYFLMEANLINKVYNFSKNIIKTERKLKKVYLSCCSFFLWDVNRFSVSWELFENYVQNTYDYEYFWKLSDREVDFVHVNHKNDIKAIEVKYRDNIKKDDLRWIKSFVKKFDVKEKIIISKSFDDNIDDVKIIPFYKG